MSASLAVGFLEFGFTVQGSRNSGLFHCRIFEVQCDLCVNLSSLNHLHFTANPAPEPEFHVCLSAACDIVAQCQARLSMYCHRTHSTLVLVRSFVPIRV